MIPKFDLRYDTVHNDEILLYGHKSTRAVIGCFPEMTRNYFLVMTGHSWLIESVFNLTFDILMDIHVTVN